MFLLILCFSCWFIIIIEVKLTFIMFQLDDLVELTDEECVFVVNCPSINIIDLKHREL